MQSLQYISEKIALSRSNINASKPRKLGVTKTKRKQEIIISLTSYPARINSAYKAIRTLLHQDFLPDRIILWLAKEQFSSESDIPDSVLELKKYGLEIRWYHDIRSYKKLIPALKEFPDALIITVDDDWFYPSNMLRILIEEHTENTKDIICHAITHPYLDADNKLRTSKKDGNYKGTSSYFNKILSGSGVLFSRSMLDPEVFNEAVFMEEAPTNDDIFFWAMAVKHGTKIRLAKNAIGLTWMTDAETQSATSLANLNSSDNLYEKVTCRMLELYPQITEKLLEETEGLHE